MPPSGKSPPLELCPAHPDTPARTAPQIPPAPCPQLSARHLLDEDSADGGSEMSRVEGKILHTGGSQLLFLRSQGLVLLRRQRASPVELTARAAPAHGLRHLGTDIFVLISLVHRVVHIDTVEPSVLSEAVLFPGITPGAFCNIGLQGGLGVDLPELHLPVKVRLPLAVGLIGHRVDLIPSFAGIAGHPPAPLLSVHGHAPQDGLLSLFPAQLHRLSCQKRKQHRVVLDP